jgi:hypothetical protein
VYHDASIWFMVENADAALRAAALVGRDTAPGVSWELDTNVAGKVLLRLMITSPMMGPLAMGASIELRGGRHSRRLPPLSVLPLSSPPA